MSAPRTRAVAVNSIYSALRKAGVDTSKFFKELGISETLLRNEGSWLPHEKESQIYEKAAIECDDQFFGFHLGTAVDPRDLGALAYVGLFSHDLNDALRNIERYYYVATNAYQMKVAEHGDTVTISYFPQRPSFDRLRQGIEFSSTALISAYRTFVGQQLNPTEVRFAHVFDGDADRLRDYYNCSVRFGCEFNEIDYPRSALALPISSRDDRLLGILKEYCDEVFFEHTQRVKDLRGRVEEKILEHLSSGRAKVGLVAAELGMSERTLARRLDAMGTSFSNLLEELRRDLALRYIRRSELQLVEIAFLLGYSNQSAFSNAFRRWTGQTPRDARTLQAS